MPVTVYPRGTTIYKPEKCLGGYTLFPYRVQGRPGAVVPENLPEPLAFSR